MMARNDLTRDLTLSTACRFGKFGVLENCSRERGRIAKSANARRRAEVDRGTYLACPDNAIFNLSL